MKHIEIVLATHGENIFWAVGLKDIIVEYSTAPQRSNPEIGKSYKRFALGGRLGMDGHGNHSDIDNFMFSLRRMIERANQIKSELGQILGGLDEEVPTTHHPLTGHKIVEIENDPNLCEANHFLTHIIKNYNSLAEFTVFLQGFPHDHVASPILEILKSIGQDFSCLPSAKIGKLGNNGHDLLARQFGEIITKKKIESSCWSAGACFMASKSAILGNPLSWYEDVLKEAKAFKDSKFALERLWAVVINPRKDWS